jgi:hypothetical protein
LHKLFSNEENCLYEFSSLHFQLSYQPIHPLTHPLRKAALLMLMLQQLHLLQPAATTTRHMLHAGVVYVCTWSYQMAGLSVLR